MPAIRICDADEDARFRASLQLKMSQIMGREEELMTSDPSVRSLPPKIAPTAPTMNYDNFPLSGDEEDVVEQARRLSGSDYPSIFISRVNSIPEGPLDYPVMEVSQIEADSESSFSDDEKKTNDNISQCLADSVKSNLNKNRLLRQSQFDAGTGRTDTRDQRRFVCKNVEKEYETKSDEGGVTGAVKDQDNIKSTCSNNKDTHDPSAQIDNKDVTTTVPTDKHPEAVKQTLQKQDEPKSQECDVVVSSNQCDLKTHTLRDPVQNSHPSTSIHNEVCVKVTESTLSSVVPADSNVRSDVNTDGCLPVQEVKPSGGAKPKVLPLRKKSPPPPTMAKPAFSRRPQSTGDIVPPNGSLSVCCGVTTTTSGLPTFSTCPQRQGSKLPRTITDPEIKIEKPPSSGDMQLSDSPWHQRAEGPLQCPFPDFLDTTMQNVASLYPEPPGSDAGSVCSGGSSTYDAEIRNLMSTSDSVTYRKAKLLADVEQRQSEDRAGLDESSRTDLSPSIRRKISLDYAEKLRFWETLCSRFIGGSSPRAKDSDSDSDTASGTSSRELSLGQEVIPEGLRTSRPGNIRLLDSEDSRSHRHRRRRQRPTSSPSPDAGYRCPISRSKSTGTQDSLLDVPKGRSCPVRRHSDIANPCSLSDIKENGRLVIYFKSGPGRPRSVSPTPHSPLASESSREREEMYAARMRLTLGPFRAPEKYGRSGYSSKHTWT